VSGEGAPCVEKAQMNQKKKDNSKQVDYLDKTKEASCPVPVPGLRVVHKATFFFYIIPHPISV
jgi:hypothetical protein